MFKPLKFYCITPHKPLLCLSDFLQEHPTAISITAVLVEYETKTGRTMKGVATNWLSYMKPENGNQYRVPIYVRKSQFRLPFKTNMPVIMIGPGTGLAPFRGFLQERHYLRKEGKNMQVSLVSLLFILNYFYFIDIPPGTNNVVS